MNRNLRAHILVSGRVQGIFFRQNTKDKAEALDLKGWVKNLPDGRVEAVFEGEKGTLEEMVEWIQKGPFLSKVDNVKVDWEEARVRFASFRIIY